MTFDDFAPDDFGLSDEEADAVQAGAAAHGLRLRVERGTPMGLRGALHMGEPFLVGPRGRGRLAFTALCRPGRIEVRRRATGDHVADCATWAEVACAVNRPAPAAPAPCCRST